MRFTGSIVKLGCAALLIFTGCSDDDNNPVGGGNPISVSGFVSKGGVNGASVNLYKFTSSAGMGAYVAGPFTTDATGAWSGEVPGGTSGSLLTAASGGTYIDEATQQSVSLKSNLYGILQVGVGKGNATPITHSMVINAEARIAAGATLQNAITYSIHEMRTALGYDPTSDYPQSSFVYEPTGESFTPSSEYKVLLGGISQLLSTPPSGFSSADKWDMVIGVAQDMTDGILQGTDAFGAPVMVDPGTGTPIQWPALDTDDISNLIDAANVYAGDVSLPTISNPDLSCFGDVMSDVGGQRPTGLATLSGAVDGTFTPATGTVRDTNLIWFDANTASISVNFDGSVVTSVMYVSNEGSWKATMPESGVAVDGSTAMFTGVELMSLTDQPTGMAISGTLGFQ